MIVRIFQYEILLAHNDTNTSTIFRTKIHVLTYERQLGFSFLK